MEIKKRVKDLTGEVFGDLKVLRYEGIRTFKGKSNSALWRAHCSCGEEIVLTRKQLYAPAESPIYNWEGPNCRHRCARNYDMAAKYVAYARHLANAKRRKILTSISLIEYIDTVSKPCHYCGEKYYRTIESASGLGSLDCNGLDRIDSLQGYTVDNIVSCCVTCNSAKGTKSYTEFLTWIERIKVHEIPS